MELSKKCLDVLGFSILAWLVVGYSIIAYQMWEIHTFMSAIAFVFSVAVILAVLALIIFIIWIIRQ